MPRRFTSSLAVIGSLAISLFLVGGAILVSYAPGHGFALPIRFEQIGASGNLKDGSVNLLQELVEIAPCTPHSRVALDRHPLERLVGREVGVPRQQDGVAPPLVGRIPAESSRH